MSIHHFFKILSDFKDLKGDKNWWQIKRIKNVCQIWKQCWNNWKKLSPSYSSNCNVDGVELAKCWRNFKWQFEIKYCKFEDGNQEPHTWTVRCILANIVIVNGKKASFIMNYYECHLHYQKLNGNRCSEKRIHSRWIEIESSVLT